MKEDEIEEMEGSEAGSLGADEEALKDQINAVMAGEEINKPAPISDVELQRNDAQIIMGERRVKILIHNQDGPGGEQPVFVAVNGVGYHIPREVPSDVPESIISALNNATETRYYREELDGQFVGPMKSKEIRRFLFTVVGR
jgi:hypothetical protein